MEEFFETLKILVEKLKGIDFAVLGTYNLYLQGIKIVPHDLDLITDDDGIYKIVSIFKSELIINEGGHKETEFDIGNVKIHVVSNINNKYRPPFRNAIVWIERKGTKIPCMSLESEVSFYEKINREKDKNKVELIRKRITNK